MAEENTGLVEEKKALVDSILEEGDEPKPKPKKKRKKKASAPAVVEVSEEQLRQEAEQLVDTVYTLRESLFGVDTDEKSRRFLVDGLVGTAKKRCWSSVGSFFPELTLAFGVFLFGRETYRAYRQAKEMQQLNAESTPDIYRSDSGEKGVW